jgi:hypothetical protein
VAEFSRPAHVQLAVDGAVVVAAWDDGTRAVPRVLVRVSTDGGSRFGPAVIASDTLRIATFPVLALGDDRLTIAWSERSADGNEHAGHAAPGAPMGLKSVGASRVMVREGTIE